MPASSTVDKVSVVVKALFFYPRLAGGSFYLRGPNPELQKTVNEHFGTSFEARNKKMHEFRNQTREAQVELN